MNDKALAHEGMVKDPSVNAVETCGRCHADAVNSFATSMHSTFNGYRSLFETRSGLSFTDHPEIKAEFDGECGKCHTTCGQCHVSRPNSVEGGLVSGHKFLATPSQGDNCTACHGSRVGEEYTGSRDGYRADAHYIPKMMNCIDCHSGHEMHGDGNVYGTRYQTPDMPRCEDCHAGAENANIWHQRHWGTLQCQVCHSQDYKSCNACHVAGGGITGSSFITFKIGKNPIPDERGYDYVVLRHIPIAEDTFEPWGIPQLSNYDALPTWKYASPHNIQRWTARTDTTGGQSCGQACHGTPDVDGWFLRQADMDSLSAAEAAANADLIVPDGSPLNW